MHILGLQNQGKFRKLNKNYIKATVLKLTSLCVNYLTSSEVHFHITGLWISHVLLVANSAEVLSYLLEGT